MGKDLIQQELEQAQRELLLEKHKTALKKQQFIKELKNGLGDEIKKNPSSFQVIEHPKVSFLTKFINFFKKLFKTF